MRRNLNPVTSISGKDSARIKNTLKVKLQINTLLKIKLQVMAIRLASLLERNFCFVLFSGNFYSKTSSEFQLAAGSEILDSKASPS